ncbi:hypothetical protein [Mesorhizobium yinganensis]|uniref:hypothetical protein n=1 Tax=Mesorhizobium yinganensis TaxID=3157707 RepID=UPI003CCDB683
MPGIPFIDVDLNTIQFDMSRSAQCQVNTPSPDGTGWSQSFTTLNDQSAKVPKGKAAPEISLVAVCRDAYFPPRSSGET